MNFCTLKNIEKDIVKMNSPHITKLNMPSELGVDFLFCNIGAGEEAGAREALEIGGGV